VVERDLPETDKLKINKMDNKNFFMVNLPSQSRWGWNPVFNG